VQCLYISTEDRHAATSSQALHLKSYDVSDLRSLPSELPISEPLMRMSGLQHINLPGSSTDTITASAIWIQAHLPLLKADTGSLQIQDIAITYAALHSKEVCQNQTVCLTLESQERQKDSGGDLGNGVKVRSTPPAQVLDGGLGAGRQNRIDVGGADLG